MCRLDTYIYDHLVKKKLHNIAKSFVTEGKVSPDPVGKKPTFEVYVFVLVSMGIDSLEFNVCCVV